MPIGVIINSLGLAFGGLAGYLIKDRLPDRVRFALPTAFGVVSMAMGITGIQRLHTLPAVVMAVVIGTLLGELLSLESRLSELLQKITCRLHLSNSDPTHLEMLIGIVVLFCASGTGIYGALESGLTGDHTILITKAFLDFFTALIFASILGGIVCLIAPAQFIILLAIFLCAGWIIPHTTPEMISDFTACGGILMLATGLRISQIKQISIVNMLPALILAMPFSYLWNTAFL